MKRVLLLVILAAVLACSQKPESTEGLVDAGKRAFTDGDYGRATQYFAEALEAKPSDRDILYLLGVSYQRNLMSDSAAYYLSRANILYPNDHEVNLQLYQAAYDIGDWKTARGALRSLVKAGDPQSKHLDKLAELSMRMEEYGSAHYYYRKLWEIRPHDRNLCLQVANTAAEIGSLQVAIALLDTAIAEFGEDEVFLANQGTFYAARRDFKAAEDTFRKLVSRDTSAVPYRLNLAHALASQNNVAKKREAYELYTGLRTLVTDDMSIDSMINRLETELNIDKSE